MSGVVGATFGGGGVGTHRSVGSIVGAGVATGLGSYMSSRNKGPNDEDPWKKAAKAAATASAISAFSEACDWAEKKARGR
jgi:hypothetical protein